ncbi:PEP-CTERM sorting domain-containing protein [Pseudorhodoferax sp. Leaf267]|uniref:PEP-CTERM sorting domain-containing protein n=1 Tax=Pseudorhodoferax sp. Leaf267 TaxID=1736316 RepID=UPI0006FE6ABE|nr:PEP-CTERM sorting domain-containing protein [Pseudorhodoferax sp. Leaf267]KQP20065.1 hypothetical protein ASF43_28315 [Pseudorhodoferax sp. Leaf267]
MPRLLLSLLLSLVALSSTHAATVRFREECGFSFAPCGTLGVVTLEQNGPAYAYFVGPSALSLAYVDDLFVMTAVNDTGRIPGGPFGLAIYPGSGPLITLADRVNTTAYGFIAFNAFPRVAGESKSVAIPTPVAEVPEPATLGMVLGGLGLVGWAGRRRRPRTAR